MTRAKKFHPYYRYNRIMSYQGTYNFLVGGRGLGKTYGAKVMVTANNIKRNEQFIYLRRYKKEMTTARNTFFADYAERFPDWDFRVHGDVAQRASVASRQDKKREWYTMGYFVTLSTAQNQKSVAYPDVTTIIFDEFIIEKGVLKYIPDEAIVFNNFYSTVDRYQDKTRVLFLANSVSIMNPYFLEYKIRPDASSDEVRVSHDGFVVCHFPDAKDFQKSIYQTKFGKFIQGTEYADYAVNNDFADNTDNLISAKDEHAVYQLSLETVQGTFSVWNNGVTGAWFVQARRPKQEYLFTLLPEKMNTEKTLLTFADSVLQHLRKAFRSGNMAFDTPTTRNAFIEVFRR